jgi:hypothetical protein
MAEDLSIYEQITEEGIKYDFVPYETPRLAEYEHPTDRYELPIGWINEPREVLIIGETSDSYIYELRESSHGEWKDTRILYKYTLPIGFHKSRLISWLNTQLSLF